MVNPYMYEPVNHVPLHVRRQAADHGAIRARMIRTANASGSVTTYRDLVHFFDSTGEEIGYWSKFAYEVFGKPMHWFYPGHRTWHESFKDQATYCWINREGLCYPSSVVFNLVK